NLPDVLMVERGQGLRLALEARGAAGIVAQRVGQCLDRDVAVQARIAGAIHLAHAARADLGDDLVDAEPSASREAQESVAVLSTRGTVGGTEGIIDVIPPIDAA